MVVRVKPAPLNLTLGDTMKTTYKCTKCCNFGPGDPCIIQMDKDCPAPTFCPSDDGKYPGADWNEISQQAVEADAGNKCQCGGYIDLNGVHQPCRAISNNPA